MNFQFSGEETFSVLTCNSVVLFKVPIIWTLKRLRNKSTATSGWAGLLWWESLGSALTALFSLFSGQRDSLSTPQSTL